jgi:hypothetical protein
VSDGNVEAGTKLPKGNHILYVDTSIKLLSVPWFAAFIFYYKRRKSAEILRQADCLRRDSNRVASEIKSHHNPDFRLQLLSKAAKLVSRSTFEASVTPKQVKSFTAQPDLFSLQLP